MYSPHFSFNLENLKASLKVFGWTVSSALVVLLIAAFADVDVPPQYAFMVPMVNTALYALKEYIGKQVR